MTGVADSSSLHYLVPINATQVLPQLFTRLIPPLEVIAELTDPRAPAEMRAWASHPPSWLSVLPVSSSVIEFGLGPEESAAIALAMEIQADSPLTDERAGTNVAKRLGLRTAGTLAILAMAAEREAISLPAAFGLLRETAFRAPDALMHGLLEIDRERHGRRS